MRIIAESKHYRIKQQYNDRNRKTCYSIIFLNDAGDEIGFNKAYTLSEAFDLCYREILLKATRKNPVGSVYKPL